MKKRTQKNEKRERETNEERQARFVNFSLPLVYLHFGNVDWPGKEQVIETGVLSSAMNQGTDIRLPTNQRGKGG